jgi:hypothetical protein
MAVVEITPGAGMIRVGAVRLPSALARPGSGAGATAPDQLLTGVLALAPERGAAATIEQILSLPDLAGDTIVIVGDADERRSKRRVYREIFTTLGRVQRPVLWVPGPVDSAFAGDVRRAYEMARVRVATTPASVPLAPVVPSARISAPKKELLGELVRSFRPRQAARLVRPAVYRVGQQGRRQWLEL